MYKGKRIMNKNMQRMLTAILVTVAALQNYLIIRGLSVTTR